MVMAAVMAAPVAMVVLAAVIAVVVIVLSGRSNGSCNVAAAGAVRPEKAGHFHALERQMAIEFSLP